MEVNKLLIEKYNAPVPRYTSYPPANHFHSNFAEKEFVDMLDESNHAKPEHIAFYVHIPFCKKICFYCGCNACVIKSTDRITAYVNALKKEIQMVSRHLDKSRKISQIHFGGGTPNSIDSVFLGEVIAEMTKAFAFIENPEIAIECNPAYLDVKYIENLALLKFNRFSLGIQDFDPEVLKSVNREPSAIPVEELLRIIKGLDPGNTVNFDFIYGLPLQTVQSFSEAIERAAQVHPDRLVTFSYAHVPWQKKHQEILAKKGIPDASEKMSMFLTSRRILTGEGYIPVGLDHYVLPEDELNIALEQNMLHRNFQGYCTRRTTGQVYAFGVSAISQLENGYWQNTKDVDSYIESIEKGAFALEKTYRLTTGQKLIKDVINRLMCNNKLDINHFSNEHGVSTEDFYRITEFHESKLDPFIKDQMLNYKNQVIEVNETGRLFIRNIASLFDPAYHQQAHSYSKTV